LSWYTILKRREGYRRAFQGFDPVLVSQMTDAELEEILATGDVIRNRLKVFSARKNAQVFLSIQQEFGSFDTYIWRFVGGKPKVNRPKVLSDIPVTTPESDALSKDLKKRGMSFVGSTIMYAHMQATGLVDDHLVDCYKVNE
jgi:DNA-3-methyladenine glycosylase I